jgi:hypothetical protein
VIEIDDFFGGRVLGAAVYLPVRRLLSSVGINRKNLLRETGLIGVWFRVLRSGCIQVHFIQLAALARQTKRAAWGFVFDHLKWRARCRLQDARSSALHHGGSIDHPVKFPSVPPRSSTRDRANVIQPRRDRSAALCRGRRQIRHGQRSVHRARAAAPDT